MICPGAAPAAPSSRARASPVERGRSDMGRGPGVRGHTEPIAGGQNALPSMGSAPSAVVSARQLSREMLFEKKRTDPSHEAALTPWECLLRAANDWKIVDELPPIRLHPVPEVIWMRPFMAATGGQVRATSSRFREFGVFHPSNVWPPRAVSKSLIGPCQPV